MPIAGWDCPSCRERVPLNHYRTSECGRTVHPDYAQAVLHDRERQPSGIVRVSHGLGCPRSSAILAVERVFVDPTAMNAALTGTAWHSLMQRSAIGPTEIEVHGGLAGVNVVGHIDIVRGHGTPELEIADHKHTNDFRRKYLKEPKIEHIVQLSLYSELYAQTFGERPHRCTLLYHFTTAPPFAVFTFDPLPVDAALAHRPYDGEYSVAELLQQADSFMQGSVVWSALPLAGESQQFSGGKTACDYCSVEGVCKVEAGRPAF